VAPSWPMSCISESSSDDDEFFDCQGCRLFSYFCLSIPKHP
jgi:hypothetical protein